MQKAVSMTTDTAVIISVQDLQIFPFSIKKEKQILKMS